jgi:chromosome segregation ATPase
MLQSAQNKIQEVEAQSIEARSAIEPTKELLAQAYNIPLPVKDQTEQLKRRERTKDPEIEAVAAEKKELLAEIKRIKAEIHNMVENLTNEIPKAMFSKGLKTEKRNTLLSLSRNLYVSDKSSLAELRECADKFRGELAKCQTDAVLRQGTLRKNCRTLIDKLAKDVDSEQHVFRRPK